MYLVKEIFYYKLYSFEKRISQKYQFTNINNHVLLPDLFKKKQPSK